jgi:hypothetical protein
VDAVATEPEAEPCELACDDPVAAVEEDPTDDPEAEALDVS